MEKEKIQNLNLPYDREDNMVSRAMMERRPFIVEDASHDPRVNLGLISFLDVKSFAVAPLLSRDKVLGGIAADNLISQTLITEKKLQSLMIFANQAALALENALMYEELKVFSSQLEETSQESFRPSWRRPRGSFSNLKNWRRWANFPPASPTRSAIR